MVDEKGLGTRALRSAESWEDWRWKMFLFKVSGPCSLLHEIPLVFVYEFLKFPFA